MSDDTTPGVTENPKATMSNSEYGDWLIAQLPEESRDGSWLPEYSDLYIYLAFYFGTIVFHIMWHYVLRFWFEKIRAKPYFMDKDEKGKLRYLEKWNSNWNHVIVMIMCYINYIEASKDCDFFTDDVCFLKMKPRFVAVEMVYIGYITENFIEYKYWIGD